MKYLPHAMSHNCLFIDIGKWRGRMQEFIPPSYFLDPNAIFCCPGRRTWEIVDSWILKKCNEQ